jgi:rhodanese-related sulfurtransferase
MMLGVFTSFFLFAALLAQEWSLDRELPSRLAESDLAKGKSLYAAHCESCHGVYGDATGSAGITPLAGLSLRLRDPRIRPFGGPSFRARGRVFPPDEASALMAYILTLRGEKGFLRADALMSPDLLDRKLARRTYLVIDLRTEAEFRKAHIRGAANLSPNALAELVRPALAPDLSGRIVVLYDEGPGIRAATLWRALLQSGHGAVAILDGGFARWVSEDREISPAVSASVPALLLVDSGQEAPLPSVADRDAPLVELQIDWQKTAGETGLRNASELAEYFQSVGFKGAGRYRLRGSETADLFAFQIHLLGYSVKTSHRPQEVVVLASPP